MSDNATTSEVVSRYARGLLLRGRGRFAEAVDELRHVIGRTDTLGALARHHYALALRSLACEAVEAGNLTAAQGHLKRAIDAAGASASLVSVLAGLFARANRPAECLRELERPASGAGAAGQDSPVHHRRLAQAQWQAGLREEAYLTLSRAMRRFPDAGSLHLQQGLFLAAEEKYAEARRSLAQAARLECDNPDAHRYLAMAAGATGDAPAAARSFQRALDLRPDDLLLAYQLCLAARVAVREGKAFAVRLPVAPLAPPATSLPELADHIADEPDLVESLCALPGGEFDGDLYATLAAATELAVESRPTDAGLHLAACRVHRRLGEPRTAQDHARRALEIDPDRADAQLQLGEIYSDTGEHQAAAEHYRAAIAAGADWPDVHLHAGEALLRCGRGDEASAHLRRSLELHANLAPTVRAKEQLAA